MSYENLILERVEHVALITLNRPDKLNALSGALSREILKVCEEVNLDDEVRAVVFTGAGRGFCSGADLTGGPRPAAAASAGDGEAVQRTQSRSQRLDEMGWVGRQAMAVYGMDKPT